MILLSLVLTHYWRLADWQTDRRKPRS